MGGSPIPQGATVEGLPGSTSASAPVATPAGPVGARPIPNGAQIGSISDSDPSNSDPSVTGEITNDVGQKVIVPKDGESFQDTLKRAVLYHNSLSPEQQKAALEAETGTMAEKVPEALAGAAGIGIAGPAALAAPGEIGAAAKGLFTAPLGMTPPIMRALPHIWQLAKTLGGLGVTAGVAHALLKEFMGKE